MDVDAFLQDIQTSPEYAGQIVHVHRVPAQKAQYADHPPDIHHQTLKLLSSTGIHRLYTHQAQAVSIVNSGASIILSTGTASGKSLCYTIPIIEKLATHPTSRSLLLFPTKALCQDQFRHFSEMLEKSNLRDILAGVIDGDTPASLRRKLRDRAHIIFTNPDMLHAAIMPQHARWAQFLAHLSFLVVDEMHVYSGIFGSNMALVMRRFFRLCRHYGADPQVIACSATIANPAELGRELFNRPMTLVDSDGSPHGEKTFVLWNPPRERERARRSRRSATVEAHHLMAQLIARSIPTITFSKAKMSAELIHRYVTERLQVTAPHLAHRISPYRGGYLPQERRAIEEELFSGRLLGVSTTPALELGIDVGSLDAGIIVGYPGTLSSFFQQAGRAGRTEHPSLAILIGLDTSVNQYIMTHPQYLFDRPIEQGVIDRFNPFVVTGHLRCAAYEIALPESELPLFGPHTTLILRILEENRKVHLLSGRWYHASPEVPNHEVSLRNYAGENVLIQDGDTGIMLGEVNRFDAEAIVHPEAIYMHRGDTWRVTSLDLDRNIATVKHEATDYYTQPLGGTDIHHIDSRQREKPFGSGRACWGEVTAYFTTGAYEKINFYTLDAVSRHGLELPTMVLETMALWIVPPEPLMEQVRKAGLDTHSGLRAIGYATRMLLPLFMTCDTLDFSHSIGSVNSEWNAIFIYERYAHGLGFTEKAYDLLGQIMPRVLDNISTCPCADGCPSCVGKPLRQFTGWNVERGEASIPSKAAALMILLGLLGDGANLSAPDVQVVTTTEASDDTRLEGELRRRLERMREPGVFHAIKPAPLVHTALPPIEKPAELAKADVERRGEHRRSFERDLHKRIAKKTGLDGLHPMTPLPPPPPGMKGGSKRKESGVRGERESGARSQEPVRGIAEQDGERQEKIIQLGDSLAARARRMKKKES